MAHDIAHHLAAARRVAHVHRALHAQVFYHRGDVIGVVVHVVPFRHLAGAAVAAAIVRNHAEPFVHEEQHLGIPVIAGQRPAVVKIDNLAVLGPQSL